MNVYVEPLIGGAPTFGPYTDVVEASIAMDERNLSDDWYKIVIRD